MTRIVDVAQTLLKPMIFWGFGSPGSQESWLLRKKYVFHKKMIFCKKIWKSEILYLKFRILVKKSWKSWNFNFPDPTAGKLHNHCHLIGLLEIQNAKKRDFRAGITFFINFHIFFTKNQILMEKVIFPEKTWFLVIPGSQNLKISLVLEGLSDICDSDDFHDQKYSFEARCVLFPFQEIKLRLPVFHFSRRGGARAPQDRKKTSNSLVSGNVLRGHQIAKAQEKWKEPRKCDFGVKFIIFTNSEYFHDFQLLAPPRPKHSFSL